MHMEESLKTRVDVLKGYNLTKKTVFLKLTKYFCSLILTEETEDWKVKEKKQANLM